MKNLIFFLLFLCFTHSTLAQKSRLDDSKAINEDIHKYGIEQKFRAIFNFLSNSYSNRQIDSLYNLYSSSKVDYDWVKTFISWSLSLSPLSMNDIQKLRSNEFDILKEIIYYPDLRGATLLSSVILEAEVVKPSTSNTNIASFNQATLKVKRIIKGNVNVDKDSCIVVLQPEYTTDGNNTLTMLEKQTYILFLSKEWNTIQEHLYRTPNVREQKNKLPNHYYDLIVPIDREGLTPNEFLALQLSTPLTRNQAQVLKKVETIVAYFNKILR